MTTIQFPPNIPILLDGGTGATAYAEAVGVYLGLGIGRLSNRLATICIWNRVGMKIEQVFARQAIPMTWDFAEANAFSDSTGGWAGSLEWVPAVLEALPRTGTGAVSQADAASQTLSRGPRFAACALPRAGFASASRHRCC